MAFSRARGEPVAPVRSIHGADDSVIPLDEGEPEEMIEGSQHLINMIRAVLVNAFIERRMAASRL